MNNVEIRIPALGFTNGTADSRARHQTLQPLPSAVPCQALKPGHDLRALQTTGGNKMKWQKAKILQFVADRRAVGRTLWTQGEPDLRDSYDYFTHESVSDGHPSLAINIIPHPGFRDVRMAAKYLELMSEFAEEVSMLTWEEFVNGEG